jgi:hypothetical protein
VVAVDDLSGIQGESCVKAASIEDRELLLESRKKGDYIS